MAHLRVASWPGFGATANPFVKNFLDGLIEADCEVISIDRIGQIRGQTPDILLLHWAERVYWENTAIRKSVIWAMHRLLRHLRLLRAHAPSTRIVWLMHNIRPHDAGPIQRQIWGWYARSLSLQVDGFLTLSPGTIPVVREAFPETTEKPIGYIWHPLYPGAELTSVERQAARARYGWDRGLRVLGYCGQIRPYKGMEELIRVFSETKRPDLRLLIAGRPHNRSTVEKLRAAAARDARIELDVSDLSERDFRDALGTCDVMIAPYRKYLHSGSIVHALSANRPVVTPATPFSGSLRAHLGEDWVRTYVEDLTPTLLEAEATSRPPCEALDMREFTPHSVGQQTGKFFEHLLRTSRPGSTNPSNM